jgi:hypothetical protein
MADGEDGFLERNNNCNICDRYEWESNKNVKKAMWILLIKFKEEFAFLPLTMSHTVE